MEQNISPLAVSIVGTWNLISFEAHSDSNEISYPFGAGAQGLLIYTETGRFSVQLMHPDRPRFVIGDQMKGTPEETETNYRGFISYYGHYEFDHEGGFVLHHVEGSLFPNWEGQSLKRFVDLSDNRLKLSTPPTLWGGGGTIIAIVEWERVE